VQLERRSAMRGRAPPPGPDESTVICCVVWLPDGGGSGGGSSGGGEVLSARGIAQGAPASSSSSSPSSGHVAVACLGEGSAARRGGSGADEASISGEGAAAGCVSGVGAAVVAGVIAGRRGASIGGIAGSCPEVAPVLLSKLMWNGGVIRDEVIQPEVNDVGVTDGDGGAWRNWS